MKKTLGFFLIFIWVTLFFYFYNMFMPKGIIYIAIGFPIISMTTFFILRKSGFKV